MSGRGVAGGGLVSLATSVMGGCSYCKTVAAATVMITAMPIRVMVIIINNLKSNDNDSNNSVQ